MIGTDINLLDAMLSGCKLLQTINQQPLTGGKMFGLFDLTLEERLIKRIFEKGFHIAEVDLVDLSLFD